MVLLLSVCVGNNVFECQHILMTRLNILIFSVMLLLNSTSWARHWTKIVIPGARCGDGSAYSVFLEQRSKEKLLIEFMGGGACWSTETCSRLGRRTWIYNIPKAPAFSYLTWEVGKHPWNQHTALYLPYCTGDVYAGDHMAQYQGARSPIWHVGYGNVVKTIEYLKSQDLLRFEEFQDVTIWGASAGAIGALVHWQNIESVLSPTARKTLIADSPGLHFGDNFFAKFSEAMQRDFKAHFARVGLVYDDQSGFVAKHFAPVLAKLSHWQVGILQGTKDLVMSKVFGEITPKEHEQRVLSDQGIVAVAQPFNYVSVWTPKTPMHTFLLTKPTGKIEDSMNKSALEFASEVYLGSNVAGQ